MGVVIGTALIVGLVLSLIFRNKMKKKEEYYRQEFKETEEHHSQELKKIEEESMERLDRYQSFIEPEEEIKKLEDKLADIKEVAYEYDNLKKEIKSLEENIKYGRNELDFIKREKYIEKELVEDYGFEKFAFEYDDSKGYKDSIKLEKNYQRKLIKNDSACITIFPITFNGSKEEGEEAQERAKKMLIRTFNGEVDVILKKLSFRNIDTSKEKIRKSYDTLNDLNRDSNGITLSPKYLESKLKELDLNYGKRVKIEEEKERKKEERELLREQKAAEREIKRELERQEKERKKKEKEIELKQKIFEQITDELGLETDAAKKAREEIERLKKELQDVLDREYAISQAEITSAGYVYIISNIGSFGEDIFKIGLTRRLEPEDRISELSSASVPFKYNCHGMIWSQDAVGLEKKLHKKFDKYRVNKVNKRKEFFRVPFSKIKESILEIDPSIELIEDVEAEEYYQSLAIERRMDEREEVENIA